MTSQNIDLSFWDTLYIHHISELGSLHARNENVHAYHYYQSSISTWNSNYISRREEYSKLV
jgi:hypothetical protein